MGKTKYAKQKVYNINRPFENFIADFLSKWYDFSLKIHYSFISICSIVLIGLLLNFNLICKLGSRISGITGLLYLSIIISLSIIDLISKCFNYISDPENIENINIYNTLENVEKNPLSNKELVHHEIELLGYFSRGLKFVVLRVFNKFFMTAITIIFAFGIMHCLIARMNLLEVQSYKGISNSASLLVFLYFSVVTFVTLGYGDIHPNIYNSSFSLAHGITLIEILTSLIFSMFGLIILIGCIYMKLSIRPYYFIAYLKFLHKPKE